MRTNRPSRALIILVENAATVKFRNRRQIGCEEERKARRREKIDRLKKSSSSSSSSIPLDETAATVGDYRIMDARSALFLSSVSIGNEAFNSDERSARSLVIKTNKIAASFLKRDAR